MHAFEIDRSLEPALRATLAGVAGDVRVHWEDVLRAPLEALEPAPTLCASNLPYSVAAPFLAESLVRLPGVRRYVVMVQREVADRLAAPPGSKTYGGLSVWVQLLAEVREVRPLSRAVFYPQPRVDSGLVTLDRRVPEGILAERPALVRRVIDAAFAQRRKTLRELPGGRVGTRQAGRGRSARSRGPCRRCARRAGEPPRFPSPERETATVIAVIAKGMSAVARWPRGRGLFG